MNINQNAVPVVIIKKYSPPFQIFFDKSMAADEEKRILQQKMQD